MCPGKVAHAWLAAFNQRDADLVASLYAEDAVVDHIFEGCYHGREAIRKLLANSFSCADLTVIADNVFVDGQWAILEWHDPKGLRGCTLLRVIDSAIVFSRSYWDRISHLQLHGTASLRSPA